MAHPHPAGDDRHAAVLAAKLVQRIAAARYQQVQAIMHLQQLQQLRAVCAFHQLNGSLRNSGACKRTAHQRTERKVAAQRFAAAAQDGRVAAAQAQRRHINRHVRPRLVHHAQHADRHPLAMHLQAVGQRALIKYFADGIGQVCDRSHICSHCGEALFIQQQAFGQRLADVCRARCRLVGGIGCQHGLLLRAQGSRQRVQRLRALRCGRQRQCARRRAGSGSHEAQCAHSADTGRASSTRWSR